VLGDLHDAHRSSLDLAHYLAQLAVRRRWLIVGAFREEEAEARTELREMLEATIRDRLCRRVELKRLDRWDCDQLVRAMLPGGRVDSALLEQVYARSLGNPLFVEELIREMQERSELVLTSGSWHQSSSPSPMVPARVRALVSMNMGRMEGSVRRVLSLAAAADQTEISLTDLRAGAAALQPPVSDVTLLDVLDRALQSRILEERNEGYAFRHPLVRSALYEDLSKHRRDQLHAALDRSTVGAARRPRLAAAGRCQ
jgi:predicted ATPase